MMVKVGKLQINLGEQKKLFRLFINSQKSTLSYMILLLGISIYSFILPGISPLLLFEIGLLGIGQIDFLQRLVKVLGNSFGTIGLLTMSLIFCLGLTIDPQ